MLWGDCFWLRVGASGVLLFSHNHPGQIAALSIVLAGIAAGA
ncbi:hypothetical protein HAALTHF_26670n [Vreelandella aquamarina]|nr:hypothetical protein HAALTHF_26670n [Halomonas axialensis]